MNATRLESPHHEKIRFILRFGGLLILVLGFIRTLVGLGSFFSVIGSFEPPRYFWCVFLGLPLLFVGASMCKLGFLGAFHRFVASESAPVAKDVINSIGENVQPGVKSVAKAMAQKVIEAQHKQQPGSEREQN